MSSKDTVSLRIVVDVYEKNSGIAEMLAELGSSVERASLPKPLYGASLSLRAPELA